MTTNTKDHLMSEPWGAYPDDLLLDCNDWETDEERRVRSFQSNGNVTHVTTFDLDSVRD